MTVLTWRLLMATTGLLPNPGEITDNWDIDRWENDGGRSFSKLHVHRCD